MRRQDIEIPEPCHADWDAMRPEDRGRFCFDCHKKVHDLSAMTEAEARGFLARTPGDDVCVSYEHDEHGTLAFQPAPIRRAPATLVPISRLRRSRHVAAAVAGVGVAAALAACTPHGEDPPIREVDAISFEAPELVIPLGFAEPATPVPPPTSTVEDEPCDAAESPAVDPEPPRVRGRLKRTAGKRKMRTAGVPIRTAFGG